MTAVSAATASAARPAAQHPRSTFVGKVTDAGWFAGTGIVMLAMSPRG